MIWKMAKEAALDRSLTFINFAAPSQNQNMESAATDPFANIYFVGSTFNGEDNDTLLIKLDKHRNIVWTRSLNNGSEEFAYAVTVDPLTLDVFISGFELVGAEYHALIAAYDNSGELKWKQTFARSIVSAYYAILWHQNRLYVVGEVFNGQHFEALISSYDKQGHLLWDNSLAMNGTDKTAYALDVLCEPQCKLVVAGSEDKNKGWLATLEPDIGSIIQQGFVAFPIFALKTKDSAIIAAGNSELDSLVINLDAQLNVNWQTALGFKQDNALRTLGIDTEGFIYLAGRLFNGNNEDGFVSVLTKNGDKISTLPLDIKADETATGLIVNIENQLFVVGQTFNETNNKLLIFRINTGKSIAK